MTINMILLMRGETNGNAAVTFVPAVYDVKTREGKVLENVEAGDFHEFIEGTINDMDNVASSYVLEQAKAIRDNEGTSLTDQQRHDLFLRLLASYSEKPMELIGNVLAGMMVGCIEGMVEDPNLDELYANYVAGTSGSE